MLSSADLRAALLHKERTTLNLKEAEVRTWVNMHVPGTVLRVVLLLCSTV